MKNITIGITLGLYLLTILYVIKLESINQMYEAKIVEYTSNIEKLSQKHESKTIESNQCYSYAEMYRAQRDDCWDTNGKPANSKMVFGPTE